MTQVMNIFNHVKLDGEEILDQIIVDKVIITLIKKFNAVVVDIEESMDLSQLLINELLGSFLFHEYCFLQKCT